MYFRWPFQIFALICASSCEKCFLILQILWKCAPRPRWEAHFRRTIFASIVCRTMFPYPNWLQNHHFSGGISTMCCSKSDNFRRLTGNGPPGKLNFTSLLISHAFWTKFSTFRNWFCYNLWKTFPVLVAKHRTFGEAITAWHEACAGAISSWSRPAAIADFTLHALFRPSAGMCLS